MNGNRVFGICCVLGSVGITAVYFFVQGLQSTPLIWLPIVLLLALGITFLLQPFLISRRESTLFPAVLRDEMDRTQALSVAMSMIILALFLFIFGRVFWRWEDGDRFSIVGTAVLTLLLLASLGIGFYSLRRALFVQDKDRSPIRQLLERRPEHIAWVYEFCPESELETAVVDSSTQAALFQPTTVYIWLKDNTLHQITMPREELDPFLTLISIRSPQAHIGYDEALAQRYHT